MKYYAVKKGNDTGVFDNWTDCQNSVKGFPGAEYKGFGTFEEAEAYINDIDIAGDVIKSIIDEGYVVAYTDGSYDKEIKKYSYGVIIIDLNNNESELCGAFNNEKYLSSGNVAGEIFGVINALDWALSNSCEKIKIFYDYEGISKWISGEWEAKADVAKMYLAIYETKYAGLLDIKFEKVKAHTNNKYNDKADALAREALSSNSRRFVQGDNWYSIPYFKLEDLKSIFDLLKEEQSGIKIEEKDSSSSIVYKLKLDKKKLRVTFYKNENRKLLVQGANTVLFQVFITYVSELIGQNADKIIGDAYRIKVDKDKINTCFNDICPNFPADYPNTIKSLIRQSIINLEYSIECEDYSQYAFPAFRAIEGHLKYLLNKAGISIKRNNGFDCFFSSGRKYLLRNDLNSSIDIELKGKIEDCYNLYCNNRHSLFHFGDITQGCIDDTRVIERKEEADELIRICLSLVCKE